MENKINKPKAIRLSIALICFLAILTLNVLGYEKEYHYVISLAITVLGILSIISGVQKRKNRK